MRACRGFSGVLQLDVDSAGIAPADYDFKDFVKPLPTTLLRVSCVSMCYRIGIGALGSFWDSGQGPAAQ